MPPPAFKRGLAWPTENTIPVHTFTKPGSRISWLYNWSPTPTPHTTSLDFVPMQWNDVHVENLPATTASSTSLLAFNEPELPSQANMTASHAASVWLAHIEPFRHGARAIRCGSPGISSAPHAVGWLRDFLAHVRAGGGDVDFLCLHWYGVGLGAFYDHIWSARHAVDPSKPVWITEFACTNWNRDHPLAREEVDAFLKESVAYLDGLEWVERYAWFGAMGDPGDVGRWVSLVDGEGRLTELGKVYRDGV